MIHSWGMLSEMLGSETRLLYEMNIIVTEMLVLGLAWETCTTQFLNHFFYMRDTSRVKPSKEAPARGWSDCARRGQETEHQGHRWYRYRIDLMKNVHEEK